MENVVYLTGKWIWEREGVRTCHGAEEKNSALIMKYNSARRVHGIIGTSDANIGRVEVKIDGNYLTKDQLGTHVKLKDGISYVDIEWPFIHNLIRTEEPEIHEVQIIPRSDNFVFNTFVFG